MRRALVVAFAFAASLLLVSAPVGTATQGSAELVVGSSHDTQSEFSNQQLTNLTTVSSGDGAVTLPQSSQVVDSFEDGDIAEYGGETGAFTTTTMWATDGSTALDYTGSGAEVIQSTTGLDRYPSRGTNVSWDYRPTNSETNLGTLIFTQDESSTPSGYLIRAGAAGDSLQIYRVDSGSFTKLSETPVTVSAYTTYHIEVLPAQDGTITASLYDADGGFLESVQATDDTYSTGGIGFRGGSKGGLIDNVRSGEGDVASARYIGSHNVTDAAQAAINITQFSNVSVEATVRTDGGTTLNQTTFSGTGNHTLTLAETSSSQLETVLDVEVTGENPQFELSDESILFTNQAPSVTSPRPTGTIHTNSPELSVDVDDATFGTAQGESVSLEWFVDGSSVGTTSVSSAGTATFEPSISDGNHTWHVVATDSYGTTTTLGDQSISVEHFAPTIESASPVDGAQLTERSTTFTVDVSDGDFGIDGDTLTGTLYLDGESVGSSSISSNGTIEVSETIANGGEHTYHWEVSDTYGYSVSTSTRSVSVPSTLRIYNESAPTELVDGASVKIQMYVNETGSHEVYVRNTSDGTINMTGLPANKPFVAVASAENYTARRIFVPSLYQSQSLFLLPKSATQTDTIFSIADYTGEYPGESTVLLVQRSLNGSYRTVAGDYFGAAGQFPVQLAYQERHRLVLLNVETGQRRVLGTYTPITSQTATVRVSPDGTVDQVSISESAEIRPSTGRLPALNATTLQFRTSNTSGPLRAVASTSTATLLNDSIESGVVSRQVDLRGHAGETLTVRITREGETVASKEFTIAETADTPTLLSALSSLTQQIPAPNRGAFTGFIAILSTIFVMGAVGGVRASGAMVGTTGVLMLAGFSTIGWVGYDLVFVAGVALVAFGGLRRGL